MKLTQENIDAMILNVETIKMGAKTTVVLATLINGFELVASSSCVDPAEYDHEVGESLALAKILDQIWLLEGYQRQVKMTENQLHQKTHRRVGLFESLSFGILHHGVDHDESDIPLEIRMIKRGFMLKPGEVSPMYPHALAVQVIENDIVSDVVRIFEEGQEILHINDIEPGPDDVEKLKARLRALRPTTNAT